MVLSVLVTLSLALPQTAVPIGYEFSAELAYPVPESVPNSLIILFSQAVNLIFYVFVSIATLKRHVVLYEQYQRIYSVCINLCVQ